MSIYIDNNYQIYMNYCLILDNLILLIILNMTEIIDTF